MPQASPEFDSQSKTGLQSGCVYTTPREESKGNPLANSQGEFLLAEHP
jgi:hypothetical protein